MTTTAELHRAIDMLTDEQRQAISGIISAFGIDPEFTETEISEILDAEKRINDGECNTYNSVDELFASL
ncbi:MAG: hypothetical protein LBN43_06855 [Oscillospiraceae bacterium]|jgi:hypothetical protein|nr:hypothetical protein [Oscillospiraceae bacterium]